MAANLAGAALTAGLNVGANKLLGGKGPNYGSMMPSGRLDVVTPGGSLRAREGGRQVTFGRSPAMDAALAQIGAAGAFGTTALDALLERVAPGYGELTQARVQAIRDAATRSISDLRGTLEQRKLAGSSFAGDLVTRAEREFAQAEELARAEAKAEELRLRSDFIAQRTGLATMGAVTAIEQSNFETSTAAALASRTQAVMSQVGASLAQLAQMDAAGAGAFAGETLGPLFEMLGQTAAKGLS